MTDTDIETDVLIVGGGGCGLTLSLLLADLGVDHILVERHETTSHLPKAHYLNQRTMEIFRQHGIAEAVYAVGTPAENMKKVRWRTTLGGDAPLDGLTFFELDAFGGGALTDTYLEHSPCRPTNYPQIRLEPLLRKEAERRSSGKIRFGCELTEFSQDAEGVTARVLDRTRNETMAIRARYMVGADGGKTVGPALGIKMEGATGLARQVSAHVSADLSEWSDDACLITWFINPRGEGLFGAGVAVPMGPTWGRHSEEWVIHFNFGPDDPAAFDEAGIVPRLRTLLNLPDLKLEVHRVSEWDLDAVLADRYRDGRVLIAGDAGHRHPPTTGLGLNTGIQDAHNLAWKLAAVLAGHAGPGLLETYEPERRPVGRRNVDWALFTALNHSVVGAGMGFALGQPEAMRQAAFRSYFDGGPMGATHRARAAEVMRTQRVEFQAHDLEMGYAYEDGATVSDGSLPPERDPMGGRYDPTTRPGHRLPHAWLESKGNRVSTHDLAGAKGSLVLLTGPEGGTWGDAARTVSASTGVPIRVVAVGPGQDFIDPEGQWARLCGISNAGAILVRPDNHVAWRSHGSSLDAGSEFAEAVEAVLAR